MKGIVFAEFLAMVEEKFSADTVDLLLDQTPLASGGAYTAVGTYDHREMVALVGRLSRHTGLAVPDLLRDFGRHLLRRFFAKFPAFFEGSRSSFEFLPLVEGYVHMEVRKLYPDAELPTFICEAVGADQLDMVYRSARFFPDLAEGLILETAAHFGEEVEVIREAVPAESGTVVFHIHRKGRPQ